MSIGFHVSKSVTVDGKQKSRSMPDALRQDIKLIRDYGVKTPCVQIFVSGPMSFKETLTSDEKLQCRQIMDTGGVSMVIHGAYLDNPWKKKPAAIHNIKQEMRIAAQIGATGVVVHLAAGAFDDDNLKHVIAELGKLEKGVRDVTTLWLEIHAAKSSDFTYETVEKLQRLFERIAAAGPQLRIGLCIDTAHLFSCGMALDTYAKATAWLDGLTNALPGVPLMLHLNDSASKLGSGVDEHAVLTAGHLWGVYNIDTGHLPIEDSGLVAILNWAESNNIMTILERDYEGAIRDLTLINQLGYFQA